MMDTQTSLQLDLVDEMIKEEIGNQEFGPLTVDMDERRTEAVQVIQDNIDDYLRRIHRKDDLDDYVAQVLLPNCLESVSRFPLSADTERLDQTVYMEPVYHRPLSADTECLDQTVCLEPVYHRPLSADTERLDQTVCLEPLYHRPLSADTERLDQTVCPEPVYHHPLSADTERLDQTVQNTIQLGAGRASDKALSADQTPPLPQAVQVCVSYNSQSALSQMIPDQQLYPADTNRLIQASDSFPATLQEFPAAVFHDAYRTPSPLGPVTPPTSPVKSPADTYSCRPLHPVTECQVPHNHNPPAGSTKRHSSDISLYWTPDLSDNGRHLCLMNSWELNEIFDQIQIAEPPRKPRCRKCLKLWHYILYLLENPGTATRGVVDWVDRSKGVFNIIDPEQLAQLWRQRKNKSRRNNTAAKFDCLKRSLRNYYKLQILTKVERKTNLYQFKEKADMWKDALLGFPVVLQG